LASGLGVTLESIQEAIDPVLADDPITTEFVTISKGQVAGLRQKLSGLYQKKKFIELQLDMYVGAASEHDSIFVKGNPPLTMRIDGGIFGDTATVASLVNTAGRILNSPKGLKTMLDLTIPRAFNAVVT